MTADSVPMNRERTQLPLKSRKCLYRRCSQSEFSLISFGIKAVDKANQGFNLGIYKAEILMDGKLIYGFSIDKVSYDDTRYLNGCIDYTKFSRDKVAIQHLSSLPGMKLQNYSVPDLSGIIHLQDEDIHNIEIVLKDVKGNTSRLTTKVQLSNAGSELHHQERQFYLMKEKRLLLKMQQSVSVKVHYMML